MAAAVKALFFDVFGTLVDWRTVDCARGATLLEPRGVALDWPAFADAWRGEYQGAMEEVRAGRIAFCKLDVLHRRNLEIALKRFGVAPPRRGRRAQSQSGVASARRLARRAGRAGRLKREYLLAPVSNGNISLMVDLARRNNLPWDAILGAEIAGDYKPKPKVYLAAAAAFDLAPDACMMVAAHSKDLAAAAALGFAPRMWRGRTSTDPAAAKSRRPFRSISRCRVSRSWRKSLGYEKRASVGAARR